MSKSEKWPVNNIKKVVIAKDYGDFMKWYEEQSSTTSPLKREEVFYLASYNQMLDLDYPDMCVKKEDLIYLPGYEENCNWEEFNRKHLPRYIKMWKANCSKEKVLEMK